MKLDNIYLFFLFTLCRHSILIHLLYHPQEGIYTDDGMMVTDGMVWDGMVKPGGWSLMSKTGAGMRFENPGKVNIPGDHP